MKRTAEAKMIHLLGGLPVRLHLRNDLHLVRKAWHMFMGLLIVYCYLAGTTRPSAIMILGSLLGLDLIVETTRLRSGAFNEKVLKFWAPVMRSHEVNQMSTVPHYISSVIIAIAIFPKPVAVLSILYLACGDPIASLCGILYGHKGPRLPGGKTVIGTLGGIAVCFLLTFVYLKTLLVPDTALLLISLVGGLAGGMAELLPFDVDDNFTIPIISGFVLWLAFMLVGV
jgi:dolichol kinase